MVNAIRRPARVNIKLLVIIAVVTGVLGVGAVAGHYVRKRVMAQNALAAGKAAVEAGEWVKATKQLRAYLSKYPDDQEILASYAEANLKVRPRKINHVAAAIGAYRRLLRHRPADEQISLKLLRLYFGVRDYIETAHVARKRLDAAPTDTQAMLWMARALAAQRKNDEAREWLEKLIEQAPQTIKAYGLMSTVIMQEGDMSAHEQALSWLDRAVASDPTSAEAHLLRARFHRLVDRDVEAARKDLQVALRLDTEDPSVILGRALETAVLDEGDAIQADLLRLEKIDEATLDRFGIDADRFALSRWMLLGGLALAEKDVDRCGGVAEEALEHLAGSQQGAFLPMAVELFLEAGRVDDASRRAEEFRAYVEKVPNRNSAQEGQLALIQASVADAQGRPFDVINALQVLVERNPDNARAWKLLWRAYSDTDAASQGLRALVAYVSRAPADVEAALALAQRSKGLGRWRDVLTLAQRVERLSPGDVDAAVLGFEAQLRGATGVLTETKKNDIAAALQETRAAHPKRADVRILLALLARDAGREQDMVDQLLSTLAECDDALTPGLYLANHYRTTKRGDLAIGVCKKIVERMPGSARPRLALAEFQQNVGKAGDARLTLDRAVQELTGDEQHVAKLAMARFQLSHGERQEGIELLQRVAEMNPGDLKPRLALLVLNEIRDQPAVAQALIGEIELVEGEAGLRWRVEQAMQWLRTGEWKHRHEEIEAMLTHCVRADEDWAQPVVVLSTMYRQLGKIAAAESLQRAYLDSHPQDMAIINLLLQLLESDGRFAEAERVLEGLPARLRELPLVQTHRVGVAMGLGNQEEVEAQLEALLEQQPNDAVARVILAQRVYANRKDVERAMSLLDEAHAMAPELTAVASTRVSMLLAEGRKEEALAVADAEVTRRNDYAAYRLRAGAHEAAGDGELAERDFRRLPELSGDVAEGYGMLAGYLQRVGKLDEALAAWDAGLKEHPSSFTLRRQMMAALLHHADATARTRGRAVLGELLDAFPEDAGLLTARAELLLRDGTAASISEAERILTRAVELSPRNVAAHLELARLSQNRGDINEALERVSRGLGAEPGDAKLLLFQAGLEASVNKLAVARELALSVLGNDPRNMRAFNLLTELAYRERVLEQAKTFNDKALAVDSTNAHAQVWHARLLAAGGERAAAISSLESLLKDVEGDPDVRVLLALAVLYRSDGDLAKAGATLDEADRVAPDDGMVFQERLKWAASQGRHDEISSMLAARRKGDRSDVAAIMAAGWALASSSAERHWREARVFFDEVIAQHPQQVDALSGAAQVSYRLGDMEATKHTYRQILAVEPYHRQALNDLAWILSADGDKTDEALELADKGVNRYPDDAHLLDTRGVILTKLGRLADARADLEACLTLAEGVPATKAHALLHLARLLSELGETELANQKLREASAIDGRIGVFEAKDRAEIDGLLNATTP